MTGVADKHHATIKRTTFYSVTMAVKVVATRFGVLRMSGSTR